MWKNLRNKRDNYIELDKISKSIDQILYLTKKSFFYLSKGAFNCTAIECISSWHFIFDIGFGYFYIKVRIPKHTSKWNVRKSQNIENYKKKLQIIAKKLEYLINYTMANYQSANDERIRTNR